MTEVANSYLLVPKFMVDLQGKIKHKNHKNITMDDTKAKLLTRLRESTNVLVTVSNNPSLDQLSGAIGLTLLLNKLGKHATAVFSGEVPPIIEYLKPEETIEKNTDSLRDFIIALDKAKADKLRYKVEDKMVKIFITPYRTSLSDADLEFSQGDFNVDVVIALGVHQQKELDQAITSHGRILHDATVSSINNQSAGNLGTINWVDTKASSLCEMLFNLCQELQPDALDAQMSTALLTGIVSETKRFANERTTARSMAISSQLVASGANQQLVAAKLQEAQPKPPKQPEQQPPKVEKPAASVAKEVETIFKPAPKVEKSDEGLLDINHLELPEEEEMAFEQIKIDDKGTLYRPSDDVDPPMPVSGSEEPKIEETPISRIITEPPTLGGKLTANSEPEGLSPAVDPLAGSKSSPLLSHQSGPATTEPSTLPMPQPTDLPMIEPVEEIDPDTIDDIEKAVASPHQDSPIVAPNLDAARDAVVNAVNVAPNTSPLPPRFDLNAQPGLELNQPPTPAPSPLTSGLPFVSPTPLADNTAGPNNTPTSPPPLPPPMMPPSGRFLSGNDDPNKKDDDLLAPL